MHIVSMAPKVVQQTSRNRGFNLNFKLHEHDQTITVKKRFIHLSGCMTKQNENRQEI